MNNEIFGRCAFLKRWDNWEQSIHEREDQISRQSRALSYPFSYRISRKTESARFSSTTDLPYYDTTLKSCTCYDFQERQLPCKHIYRLAHELKYIEIIDRSSKEYIKARLDDLRAADDIDSQPEQIKRIERSKESKYKPISIDYDARKGVFAGSGKKPYETTEDSCTCKDYLTRRLPCKHIYRLRDELRKNL